MERKSRSAYIVTAFSKSAKYSSRRGSIEDLRKIGIFKIYKNPTLNKANLIFIYLLKRIYYLKYYRKLSISFKWPNKYFFGLRMVVQAKVSDDFEVVAILIIIR